MSLISIIVPVYNAENYLHRCIDSVINQTYSDWELLLINDGSVDNSGAICEDYARQDRRIKYFFKSNGGVGSARNLGLKYASGEWIQFLDSDDWISSECLDICLKEVVDNKLDILQYSHSIAYPDGTVTPLIKKTTDVYDPASYIQHGTFNVSAGGNMFRKSIVDKCKIEFNQSLKLAEDQIFILNLIQHSSCIKFLANPMYFYFQNSLSAVHNQKSSDLIAACNELIKLKEWKPATQFIDTMCIVFLIDIIKSGDVATVDIIRIYNRCTTQYILPSVPKSVVLFSRLAKLSPRIAIHILSLYFKLKR